jgi:hypothetical protein
VIERDVSGLLGRCVADGKSARAGVLNETFAFCRFISDLKCR